MSHRWLPLEANQIMIHAAYKEQPEAINVGFAQAYRTMVLAAPNAQHPAVVALRRLAIIDTHVNTQGKVVVDGSRCRVCLCSWKLHALEQHATDCPLKGNR